MSDLVSALLGAANSPEELNEYAGKVDTAVEQLDMTEDDKAKIAKMLVIEGIRFYDETGGFPVVATDGKTVALKPAGGEA